VEEDVRLAKEAGIDGTPTFLINGTMLAGAQSLSSFKDTVDQALGRPRPPSAPVPCDPAMFAPATAATRGAGPADPGALARAAAPGNAPAKGEPGAPVTIVLFNDFQCEFSRRNAPVMDELLAAYPKQLRVVVKNLPLLAHQQAPLAAEAALAAHEQGKFWPMHDRLFANQGDLTPEALERHAAQVGLDLDRFRAAMKERRFRPVVERDVQDARAAGINATPTALINGRQLSGAWPIDSWRRSVQRELDRTRGLVVGDEPLPASAALDGSGLKWPPPRVRMPDELLGERLTMPVPTGDAPSMGAARAPVEVLYLFGPYDGPGRWGKRMVDHLREAYGDNLRIVARPVPSSVPPKPEAQLVAEAAWAAPRPGQVLANARPDLLAKQRTHPGQPRAGRRRDRARSR
jgi:protein-disulfide isomerase